MRWFTEFLSNQVLMAALLAQLSSQGFKVVRRWLKEKKIRLSRVSTYGDFPSAHTAFLTAGTITAGLTEGFDSAVFALGVVFSAIVITDALVQRTALEKTQDAVTEMAKKPLFDPHFRGHTPLDVISGVGVGCVWTAIVLLYWPF